MCYWCFYFFSEFPLLYWVLLFIERQIIFPFFKKMLLMYFCNKKNNFYNSLMFAAAPLSSRQISLTGTTTQYSPHCLCLCLRCCDAPTHPSDPCVSTLAGVVPEPEGQVEEAGALRPDPASQNSLCGHVRFVGDTADRQLHAGKLASPWSLQSVSAGVWGTSGGN